MKTETRCPRCERVFLAEEIDRKFAGLCPECLGAMAMEESSVPTTTAGDPPPLQPGARFRGLEVLEVLGQGGMGTVYRARQPELDRAVALKILSPRLASDPEFAERFHREARALASLNHPNIVHVHEFGKEGKLLFLTMEFVDGTNLRSVMRDRKLGAKEALAIVPQICDALEYAHSQGIVHRDIKPENILIDRQGRVKIADFGLAKLAAADGARVTKTNVVMGTPHYMAPEQVESLQDVDSRADIYSLGVVFYEMLTGELPIGRFAPPSKKVRIDVRLDEVVLKALEKDRELRYQRAAEVKTGIDTAASAPIPPPTESIVEKRVSIWPYWLIPLLAGIAVSVYGNTLLSTERFGIVITGTVLLAFASWVGIRNPTRWRWAQGTTAGLFLLLTALQSTIVIADEIRVGRLERNLPNVSIGKSREEVHRVLGDPTQKYDAGTFGLVRKESEEVWVYRGRDRLLMWQSGSQIPTLAIERLFAPAERDHVLYFDASGKLVKIE